MMVMLRPYVVLEATMVVVGLSMVVMVEHPLKHLLVPPYVHDNHTDRRLYHTLTIVISYNDQLRYSCSFLYCSCT
jgi:hypothetical protein